jgi:hypothetical protein
LTVVALVILLLTTATSVVEEVRSSSPPMKRIIEHGNDNYEDNFFNDVDGRPRRQCSRDIVLQYITTNLHEGLSVVCDLLRFCGSTSVIN